MREFSVSKEYDNKSMQEMVRYMEQEMGFKWNADVHLASLDGKIITQNNLEKTLVHEGQIVKLFPLPTGG